MNLRYKDERDIVRYSVITAAALILLNIVDLLMGSPSWQIHRFIYVNQEANFPSWFSSAMFLFCASITFQCSKQSNKDLTKKQMYQFLTGLLLLISCDEIAQIHESIGHVLKKQIGTLPHSFNEIVFFGPFLLILIFILIYISKVLFSSDKKVTQKLGAGVSLFVLGAFIVEIIGSILTSKGLYNLVQAEILIEESAEMFGAILIMAGLIDHKQSLKALNNEKN